MKNWAGNYTFRATEVTRPKSVSQLVEIVAAAANVRAIGTRHSFTDVADAPTVVDTTGLREQLELSLDRTTATVNASMTYGRLAHLLVPLGFAVHNLASLPHISIGGAIATATHGSGVGNGSLASAVAGVELVTSSGEIGWLHRGDADFGGAVVSLGALGVLTRVALDIEPTFDVSQRVYDDIDYTTLTSNFDEVMSAAYSVSGFTRWDGNVEQMWVKDRLPDNTHGETFFGAREAEENRHPIRELDAAACTAQLGVPGPWYERLPHFRMDFTPSAGEEIQSEFFVERRHGPAALDVLRSIGDRLDSALLISEIRAVASDSLWMSPMHDRETLALHFTWGPDQHAAEEAAALVGDVLAEFDARTHWGKVFAPRHSNVESYEKLDAFLDLISRFDPKGAFRNDWFDRILG